MKHMLCVFSSASSVRQTQQLGAMVMQLLAAAMYKFAL